MKTQPPLKFLLQMVAAGLLLLALGAHAQMATDKPTGFVDLARHVPGIVVDTPYATADNFLKKPVYPANRVYLRRSVADRLVLVQGDLKAIGYGLKVLDGFRPLSVQRSMWKIRPDSRYVADPARGSRHNRGAAVDVTLVDAQGRDLEMPTKFDEFSKAAHLDAPPPNAKAGQHRNVLQEAMKRRGFLPLSTEWWHFDSPDWQTFPLADTTFEELAHGVGPRDVTATADEIARVRLRLTALEDEIAALRRKLRSLEEQVPAAKESTGNEAAPAEIKGRPAGR